MKGSYLIQILVFGIQYPVFSLSILETNLYQEKPITEYRLLNTLL
jgi:hypothetical protein